MNATAIETLVDTYCCEQEFIMMSSANFCTHLINLHKRDIGVWEEILRSIEEH